MEVKRHEEGCETCSDGKLRVLELYSGIGGMHLALRESGLPFEVVAAVDINTVTNAVYRHNFPLVDLKQRSIESLNVKELNKLSPDMILMSPPCQPFTRVGKQKDSEDIRTASFFHVLDLLPQFSKPVKYILVENVKGFDTSQTKATLMKTLAQCQYHVQEFLMSPLQFGIPNSRLRYYLLAKKAPLQFCFPVIDQIHEEIPECAHRFCVHISSPYSGASRMNPGDVERKTTLFGDGRVKEASFGLHPDGESTKNKHLTSCHSNHGQNTYTTCSTKCMPSDAQSKKSFGTDNASPANKCTESSNNKNSEDKDDMEAPLALHKLYSHLCRPVREYLESDSEEYFMPYMLPEKLYKTFWVADIVKAGAQNSCCFTKRYSHHMDGAGSLLQMNENPTFDLVKFKDSGIYGEEAHELVRALKLRFFTPREVANLLCFPADFNFPPDLSLIQCYRCLGNSLNVHVVSVLLRLLTMEES